MADEETVYLCHHDFPCWKACKFTLPGSPNSNAQTLSALCTLDPTRGLIEWRRKDN